MQKPRGCTLIYIGVIAHQAEVYKRRYNRDWSTPVEASACYSYQGLGKLFEDYRRTIALQPESSRTRGGYPLLKRAGGRFL